MGVCASVVSIEKVFFFILAGKRERAQNQTQALISVSVGIVTIFKPIIILSSCVLVAKKQETRKKQDSKS